MKTYFLAVVLAVVCIAVCSLPSIPQAQEDDANYSYGIVSSVDAGKIVINEYDYETDAETDVTYVIDGDTQFQNVDSAAEIIPGAMADVDYVTKDGKNIARTIMVEAESTMPVMEEDVIYIEEDEELE